MVSRGEDPVTTIRLTKDERAWLEIMPVWTNSKGKEILSKFDALEAEVARLREALADAESDASDIASGDWQRHPNKSMHGCATMQEFATGIASKAREALAETEGVPSRGDYARNDDGSYITPEQTDEGWAVQ